jgi:asparagine synthase (glutamine-hydrolysing)
MCGLAGIFGPMAGASMEAALRVLARRGPDDHGLFRDAAVCLAHTRLSIIDTSDAGHQPMGNADGSVWIAYNGELYDFADQRAALERGGYVFRSRTDTEVILALYERYGDDCVSHLRGMFAFAIYDRRGGPGRERLLLARDHVGIKPLVYAQLPRGIAFASDLRALVAAGLCEVDLDAEAVRQLLTRGAVFQPRTILRGVLSLEPGCMIVATANDVSKRRYWAPAAGRLPDIAHLPFAQQSLRLAETLRRVVREQLVSDVPLGAFLSGGLDSSVLVALMSEVSREPVRTFSVGFGEDGRHLDETDDAEEVARRLGTRHTRLEVGVDDVAADLDDFVTGLVQPTVDGLNSYMVSKVASRDVTVALSGTGADEVFAGYPWFAAMSRYAALPRAPVYDVAEALLGRLPASLLARSAIERRVPPGFLGRFSAQYRHFSPAQVARLTGRPAFELQALDNADLSRADVLAGSSPIDRTSGLCLSGYLGNQLLRDIDATSMAHSIEVRVPYLDPDVIDLALSLPADSRLGPPDPAAPEGSYRSTGVKRILVDVARGLLPEAVLDRPKRGFGLPLDVWLRGSLRHRMEDALGALSPCVEAVVSRDAVAEVKDRFLAEQCHWGQPWLLMVLELWCRDALRHRSALATASAA